MILFATCVHLRGNLRVRLVTQRKFLPKFNLRPFANTCQSVWPGLKPWPNGVASRRKLKTWVYLQLRLARPCVHLRWLAMTCAHFGRGQICTQVKASFSPFGHPTQVNASWATSINLLLANEIQDMSALKWVFLRLTCTCEETCECVWPPNASLYASSTCVHLRLLAGPFDQGFNIQICTIRSHGPSRGTELIMLVRKLHSGTFKTKELVPVQPEIFCFERPTE